MMSQTSPNAHERIPRPANSGMKSNFVLSSTLQRRIESKKDIVKKNGSKKNDDFVALQAMLLERTEQVERLEALVSEKRLFQRREERLEECLRYQEGRLAQLAAAVRGESQLLDKETTATTGEKTSFEGEKHDQQQQNIIFGASTNKLEFYLREISNGVLRLRYEKSCMVSELQGKEKLLADLREELRRAQNQNEAGELPLEKGPTDINLLSDVETSNGAVALREQILSEAREKQRQMEKRLQDHQEESRRLRQKFRESEKEVLKWQRKYREIMETQAKRAQHIDPSVWKLERKMVTSRHSSFFCGAEWPQLLREKPDAMRNAFLNDVSLELCAPRGFLSVVEMRSGNDLVSVDIDVRHPASLLQNQVELYIMQCPFNEMKELLNRKDEPKEGLDKVTEELNNTQIAAAEKDAEIGALREQLKLAETLFQQQREDHDACDQVAHQALDETEQTLKTMYRELKEERKANKQLQKDLRDATEALETRDQTLKELSAQLKEAKQHEEQVVKELGEVRSKTLTSLGEMEKKLRQEQQQQMPPPTRVISHTFLLECSAQDRLTAASLDSNGCDILRALLLSEAAVFAKAVPLKVSFFACGKKEVQVGVQLQINTSTANMAKNLQSCLTPVSKLFLQEWFAMKSVMDDRRVEIERLEQELMLMKENAEKHLEANKQMALKTERQLHLLFERARIAEEAKADLTKELFSIHETLASHGSSVFVSEQVASLVAKLEEEKRLKATIQQEFYAERALLHALEQKHKQLQEDYVFINKQFTEQTRKLKDLQVKWQRITADVSEAAKAEVDVNGDVVAALYRSYETYSELQKKMNASFRQQLDTEKSLWGKLRTREVECERLGLQLAELQKELQERQLAMENAEFVHQRHKSERDDIVNRIQQEMQLLSNKLMENEAIKQETEAANKALEIRVAQLREECDIHKDERGTFYDVAVLLEEKNAVLKKKIKDLRSEIAIKSQRAEEIMRQLVFEEDARRAAEAELMELRRSKEMALGDETEVREEVKVTEPDLRRLRNFCVSALNLSLTGKEQSLGDIIALMEQQHGVVKRSERVSAAIFSMDTASQLLRRCLATMEEFSDEVIHIPSTFTLTSDDEKSDSSKRRVQDSETAQLPKLVNSAALILQLARILADMSVQWKEKLKQGSVQLDTLTAKFCELSVELRRIQAEVLQQQETAKPQMVPPSSAGLLRGDVDSEFLRMSRANALCVVLSVKDCLHDALAALRLTLVSSDEASVVASGPIVNSTNNLCIAEGSLVDALKRIVDSVAIMFSPKERQGIEARRGADYFAVPDVSVT